MDAVATPEAPLLPQNIVVVLSRQAGAAQSATDYRVVSDTRVRNVEDDVNALAAKGCVLKGVTLDHVARLGQFGPSAHGVWPAVC